MVILALPKLLPTTDNIAIILKILSIIATKKIVPIMATLAVTEKTICCRELDNLSALYPYIVSEHEIEC